MVNIKMLFIIIEEGYDKKIKYFLNKYGIKLKTVSKVYGTASVSVLNYFGLLETEKELFMAIIPDYLSNEILVKLKDNFKLDKIGMGLAFTISISGSNKFLSDIFKESNGSEVIMEKKEKFHLIVTIVSEGYLENVMTAAKKAGASGGTAIKGRGLGYTKRAKILGFNIEPERDIVLNIVPESDKNKIMEAITKEVGIKTDARGYTLSLPIDDVISLDM